MPNLLHVSLTKQVSIHRPGIPTGDGTLHYLALSSLTSLRISKPYTPLIAHPFSSRSDLALSPILSTRTNPPDHTVLPLFTLSHYFLLQTSVPSPASHTDACKLAPLALESHCSLPVVPGSQRTRRPYKFPTLEVLLSPKRSHHDWWAPFVPSPLHHTLEDTLSVTSRFAPYSPVDLIKHWRRCPPKGMRVGWMYKRTNLGHVTAAYGAFLSSFYLPVPLADIHDALLIALLIEPLPSSSWNRTQRYL